MFCKILQNSQEDTVIVSGSLLNKVTALKRNSIADIFLGILSRISKQFLAHLLATASVNPKIKKTSGYLSIYRFCFNLCIIVDIHDKIHLTL